MRTIPLVLVPAGIALGLVAEWTTLHRPSYAVAATAQEQRLAAGDLVVGVALLVCGTVCRRQRPESRIGPLLVAAGLAWFLGTFAGASFASVAAIGALLVALHRGPLVHAVLSYPDGRLSGPVAWVVVAAVYAASAIADFGQSAGVRIALAAVLAATAARAYARSRGSARRARLPALAAAIALAAVLAAGGIAALLDVGGGADRAVLWAYEAVIVLVAAMFALDLARGRWTEATMTSLVLDLGDVPEEGLLRERLAAALGDRTLALGFWSPDEGAFLDGSGRPLDLSRAAGSEVTIVRESGAPVAVLVHDATTLEDPTLRESVAAAVRVAVANVRLQREIRRQAEELTASRRRIVEAADLERRRLERELHDRTEARLEHLEHLLADAATDGADPEMLAETLRELEAARTELAELAQGIHPRVLTERGLSAALADLARRAPMPVEVAVPDERLPAAIEAAVYFVCSEALANVAKHANASSAAIEVVRANGRLRVAVSDDGAGGAEAAGSGLRGLADRVEALGGRFEVESTPDRGTTVAAELPVGEL